MIPCDFCKNDINMLKDICHSIPLDDCNFVLCDSCYRKFINDIQEKTDGED